MKTANFRNWRVRVISLRCGIWSLSGHSGPGKPSAGEMYGFTALNSFVSLPLVLGCATMGEVTRVRRNSRKSKKGRD